MTAKSTIPAATILLLRDEPSFEVLMIERHADIKFAGGAMVFPGGKIDKHDTAPIWKSHCTGLDNFDPAEHAPRIAAIREAYEETGILLARDAAGAMIDADGARALDQWRSGVESDASKFLELIRNEKLFLACDALCLFARWQPPIEAKHQRYHTWFFAAKTPLGQNAREDGNEATEALWTTPQHVLNARARGDRKMIFPTVRNVELLNVSENVEDVFDFASRRRIESVEPRIIKRNGDVFVTIPNDLGYPVTEEPIETAFRT